MALRLLPLARTKTPPRYGSLRSSCCKTERLEGVQGGRLVGGTYLPRGHSSQVGKEPPASHNHEQAHCPTPTYLISLPASDAHCRIRALSSLSALLSTPEREEEVDQEASLRGGRSLSEPMEAVRLCLLRPSRLRDLDEGVDGLTRWASYAFCVEGGNNSNARVRTMDIVTAR